MGFEIIYSPEALTDLLDILEYTRDRAFVEAIETHVEMLSRSPLIGREVAKRRHIRKIYHPPYLIYYRVLSRKQVVEILRIWHGARRRPAFPDRGTRRAL